MSAYRIERLPTTTASGHTWNEDFIVDPSGRKVAYVEPHEGADPDAVLVELNRLYDIALELIKITSDGDR